MAKIIDKKATILSLLMVKTSSETLALQNTKMAKLNDLTAREAGEQYMSTLPDYS